MSIAEQNGDYKHVGNSDLVTIETVPNVLHEGRYRLYQKPDGGIHLVYKRDDKDTEDHMEIPGAMLRLAQMASEGNMSFPQFVREAMRLKHELSISRREGASYRKGR